MAVVTKVRHREDTEFHLLALPNELICLVAKHLRARDLIAFSQTSQKLATLCGTLTTSFNNVQETCTIELTHAKAVQHLEKRKVEHNLIMSFLVGLGKYTFPNTVEFCFYRCVLARWFARLGYPEKACSFLQSVEDSENTLPLISAAYSSVAISIEKKHLSKLGNEVLKDSSLTVVGHPEGLQAPPGRSAILRYMYGDRESAFEEFRTMTSKDQIEAFSDVFENLSHPREIIELKNMADKCVFGVVEADQLYKDVFSYLLKNLDLFEVEEVYYSLHHELQEELLPLVAKRWGSESLDVCETLLDEEVNVFLRQGLSNEKKFDVLLHVALESRDIRFLLAAKSILDAHFESFAFQWYALTRLSRAALFLGERELSIEMIERYDVEAPDSFIDFKHAGIESRIVSFLLGRQTGVLRQLVVSVEVKGTDEGLKSTLSYIKRTQDIDPLVHIARELCHGLGDDHWYMKSLLEHRELGPKILPVFFEWLVDTGDLPRAIELFRYVPMHLSGRQHRISKKSVERMLSYLCSSAAGLSSEVYGTLKANRKLSYILKPNQ